MLIKSADDKAPRVAMLQALQARPRLPARVREWAQDELMRLQRGAAGERDAAHFLDNYLSTDPDRMLIHDLRLQVDGEVVQIDHLLMTRGPMVYLLETKHFNGELRINGRGEFSVRYAGGREYGIESPIEQSRRHEGPLRRLMKTLGICGRSGGEPIVRHCVLVHPRGSIERPPQGEFDTGMVIKADQFRSWHERMQQQELGLLQALSVGLNMRSADTIRDFAEKLVRQHRRPDLLALPGFVQEALQAAEPAPVPVPVPAPAPESATAEAPRRLLCAQCGGKISFAEGRFCWNQPQRFGGQQYCREHQAGR